METNESQTASTSGNAPRTEAGTARTKTDPRQAAGQTAGLAGASASSVTDNVKASQTATQKFVKKAKKTRDTAPPKGVSTALLSETKTAERSHLWTLGVLVVSVVLFVAIGGRTWTPTWLQAILLLLLAGSGLLYMYFNMRVFILKSERKRSTKAALAAEGAANTAMGEATNKNPGANTDSPAF